MGFFSVTKVARLLIGLCCLLASAWLGQVLVQPEVTSWSTVAREVRTILSETLSVLVQAGGQAPVIPKSLKITMGTLLPLVAPLALQNARL